VLIGAPASEFHLPSNPLLVTNIPSIPAGIPSSVLTRRPDIAEAERVMAAKHALINVAYASFFPDFSITGGGGLASIQLKHFLNLKNYFFEFGANLIQSIIDAGRNRSNLNAAKARFQQAEGSYQQLVLKAFQEVEDSLSAIEYQEHQSEDIFSAFNSSQKLSSLSERRYNVGIVNELEVLNNKKSLLETEQLWIQITSLRYQSTLSLIKALGGSWSN
jgi:multidrug efflux system outer membrane protein